MNLKEITKDSLEIDLSPFCESRATKEEALNHAYYYRDRKGLSKEMPHNGNMNNVNFWDEVIEIIKRNYDNAK